MASGSSTVLPRTSTPCAPETGKAHKVGNRLAANAPRYGLSFQENGTSILLWSLVGYITCGIGGLVAMYLIIKNTNALATAYNSRLYAR